MIPTAFQIIVDKKPKIVGKMIVMPQNKVVPKLAGHWCLFREVKWKDLVSYKLKSIGIDAEVWRYCNEEKIGGMFCYCADAKKALTVKRSDINMCRSVDLGEHPQIRIPLSKCTIYENVRTNIPTAWITNVVTIEPKKGWIEDEKQTELF